MVSHDSFVGLAQRPWDTTYSDGEHVMTYEGGLVHCLRRWEALETVAV